MVNEFFRDLRIHILLLIILLGSLSACIPVTSPVENLATQSAFISGQTRQTPREPRAQALSRGQGNTPVQPPVYVMSGEASAGLPCPELIAPRLTDLSPHPVPELDTPMARVSFYDPVFGTCLARLTDYSADHTTADPGLGMTTPGAAMQAFNADGSLALVRSTASYWYLYATDTLEFARSLPFLNAKEAFWDPLDPRKLYFTVGPRLFSFNLDGDETREIHNFALDFPNKRITWVGTNNAGGLAPDGRTWGLFVRNASGSARAVLLYDMIEDRVVAHLKLPEGTLIHSARFSPTGSELLVMYETGCTEELATLKNPFCGLVAYNHALDNARVLLPTQAEFDVALDADLREVVVYLDFAMNSISMLDLKSGKRQALWLIDPRRGRHSYNLAGRANQFPGWVLISTYTEAQSPDIDWMDNSVFAIELKPEGHVARLAHTHAVFEGDSPTANLAQPQASVNAAFTQILFASNWGMAQPGEMDVYLIRLPEGWNNQIP